MEESYANTSRRFQKILEILSLSKELHETLVVEKDEFDIYGEHIATQLRNLKDKNPVPTIRRKIDDIVFSAVMGDFDLKSKGASTMSRRKTDYEETDAERIPLRNIRRKIAVNMENGRQKYFDCRNKECTECDKPAMKHEKYWDAKKETKLKNNSRSHSAYCGVKKVPAVQKTNYDFDRIVENATVEYDFNKNRRKSILDSLGLEKKPKCQKPKIVQKKKERRDENDIYGEHIAMQLRKLKNPKTVALARLKIDQIIFSSSIGDRAWTTKHLNKIVQKRHSSKIRDSQNTEKAE